MKYREQHANGARVLIDGKQYEPDPNRPKALRRVPETVLTYDTYIYFVQCEVTKRVKIGSAANPFKRFQALQCGSPTDLTMIGVIWGPRTTEKKLHAKFARHRVRGEWFEGAPELMEYVKQNAPITPTVRNDLYALFRA